MPVEVPHQLQLRLFRESYSIMRFAPDTPMPSEALGPGTGFLSMSRSDNELSLIGPTLLLQRISEPHEHRSDDWSCLRVETTTLPAEVPGIIASVVAPLADAGISVFAVASFDTDHVLVQDIEQAKAALHQAGHDVGHEI